MLTNPYSNEETIEILNNLVTLTGLQDAYVWWAVTRGEMQGTRERPTFINKFYAYVTPYMFVMGDDVHTRGGNIGSTPGPMTRELHNLYWTKRWDGWLGDKIAYN